MHSQRRDLNFISVANIIGTVLVVFGHSYTLDYDDITPVMLALRTFIYYFHMPLFFFISGFLMSYSKSVEKRGWTRFIGHKAVQLLAPYLFLTLVFYVPKKMLSHEKIGAFDLFRNVFEPRSNIWGHLWFLPALFFITLIISLMLLLLKKAEGKGGMLINAALLTAFIALSVLPVKIKWLALSDITANLVYFFMGCVSADLVLSKLDKLKKPFVLVAEFAVAVGLSYVRYNYLLRSNLGHALLQFVICIIMLAFVLGLSALLSNYNEELILKLNSYTYTVYLYSWIFQTVVYYITFNALHLQKYIACPLMFAAGLMMPIVMSAVYSRLKFLNNRFFDTILGIKVKRK